jgi:hypothetical protein
MNDASYAGLVAAGGANYSKVWATDGSGIPAWRTPSSGGVTTVGSIDTSKNANGLYISGSNIYTQTADSSYPGMVSTTNQIFAGIKSFYSDLIVNTASGDATVNIKGSSPSGTFFGTYIYSGGNPKWFSGIYDDDSLWTIYRTGVGPIFQINATGVITSATWHGASIGTAYTDAKCTATWPNSYSANQSLGTGDSVTHVTITGTTFKAGGYSNLSGQVQISNDASGAGTATVMIGTNGSYASLLSLHCHGQVQWDLQTKASSSYLWFSNGSGDRFSLDLSGNAIFYGNVTANGTPSDARLKSNVLDYLSGMGLIEKLSPKSFTWNEQANWVLKGTNDIGLIAQEVRAIIPEAIHVGDDGMLSLKYDRLVPVLINALKELNTRVKELENGGK